MVEISLLLGLSMLYTALRARPHHKRPNTLSPTSSGSNQGKSSSSGNTSLPTLSTIRERPSRNSVNHGHVHGHGINPSPAGREHAREKGSLSGSDEDGHSGISGKGCVWGTQEREYRYVIVFAGEPFGSLGSRECLDDGVLFALLLAPLVSAAMLHSSFVQLINDPIQATLDGWMIESPLVLPSTPIRLPPSHFKLSIPHTDAIKALSALATSRRNLVQLFTLCSFVLLVQLSWSIRLEKTLAKKQALSPVLQGGNTTATGFTGAEGFGLSPSGIYWLKKGEWRRNLSVVGMAFVVTAGCLVVKVATAYIGHGVWSGKQAIVERTDHYYRYVAFRYCHRYLILPVQSVCLRPTCSERLHIGRARGCM
jgi:dolichol kinase